VNNRVGVARDVVGESSVIEEYREGFWGDESAVS
jgi:hypothetical protein